MQPPDYFDKVERQARTLWNRLENDVTLAEVAGAWHLLFSQVQSPPHVFSELLQNADDAGAKKAVAKISNGEFTFEHDGEDFDAEQFGSLCRFAFSNKRTIHTIGFRGIGFKSTFSLADEVEVRTPTLAVRFDRARFTLPIWAYDPGPAETTIVRIRIADQRRTAELAQSLQNWATSAASLLFFRKLERLEINGKIITKRRLGAGPVPNSDLWALTHVDSNGREQTEKLLVFRSEPESFPAAALDEIRRERNISEMNLPPCRVEVVLGLSGSQKAFVVLPTGAILDLPFSINAPFLQDPARFGIKEPSTSPTNRWLLERAGQMVADALADWLARQDLPIDERANAYMLVPKPEAILDNANSRVTPLVRNVFLRSVKTKPVMLLSDGQLGLQSSCFCLPYALHSVWSELQLVQLFGGEIKNLLSVSVASEHRTRLTELGWLKLVSANDVLAILVSESVNPPKPESWAQLQALWTFVSRNTPRYDARPKLAKVVPVVGREILSPANQMVRLPSRSDRLSPTDWQFVMAYALTVDPDWLDWLEKSKSTNADSNDTEDSAVAMLAELGLRQATAVDVIVAQASRRLFAQKNISGADCVRFAQILAALGARVPNDFKFVTRDCSLRPLEDSIVFDPAGEVQDLVPPRWSEAQILNAAYTDAFVSCTAQQWETWARSGSSGLHLGLPILQKSREYRYIFEFDSFLKQRGIAVPSRYPYGGGRITFDDWGFDDEVLRHWNATSAQNADHWGKVLRTLLNAPSAGWSGKIKTESKQHWGRSSGLIACGEILPEWVELLRSKSCLPDTRGFLRQPAELLLRTPDTEALRDIEPFVDAFLDTPGNRPLLERLGVRTNPSSPTRVLERLEALTHASQPLRLVVEINRLYEALDRVVSRCSPADLNSMEEAFSKRALILSEAGEWVSSGEISIFSDDDELAPAIHHSFHRLAMWPRLGVAEKPAFERSVGWLQSLASGGRIDAAVSTRLRLMLQREPSRVWFECKHWLSLDQAWEPIARLSNRQTMLNLGRWEGLVPAVKRATADFRMLPEAIYQQPPFGVLRDLMEIVEFRVTDIRAEATADSKPWLAGLGGGLCRVRFNDEERMQRVRSAGQRLAETVWRRFSLLEVTPYVDAAPAGVPCFPRVLWRDETLYVTSGVSLAKLHRDLADELSRPFGDRSVADAITACIERSADYVAEYLADQFVLDEPVKQEPLGGKQAVAGESSTGNIEADVSPAVLAETENTSTGQDIGVSAAVNGPSGSGLGSSTELEAATPAESAAKLAAPPKPALVELYAKQRGFIWDSAKSRYTHSDLGWIEKAQSPFNWQEHNADGTVATRIWFTEQRLKNGVEVATELWGLASREPSTTAIVILSEDHTPCFLSGQSLLRLKNERKIEILPSSFRIVEAPQ